MAAEALVTIEQVRARLGPAWADRPDAAALIAEASSLATTYCRRLGWLSAAETETRDGDGRPALFLARPPATAIASVEIDGVTLDADEYELSADGRTLRRDAGWDCGSANIVVSYTGGLDAVPERVQSAVLLLVRWLGSTPEISGLYRSRSVGDYSYTVDSKAGEMPEAAKTLLSKYRLTLTRS